MTTEPICIRRAGTVEEADIVVAWLADQGIETTIVDRSNPGVLAFGVTDIEGIAICVADQQIADRAMELLTEHDRLAKQAAGGSADGVDLTCEECGKTVTANPGAADTTLECPHCGAYVDVPGTSTSEPS
jgi:hypothetical protein